jgi:hypothetical protein
MKKLLGWEMQLHRENHNISADYLDMTIKVETVKACSFL